MIQIVFELSKGRPLVKKLNDVISNWLIQTLVSSIFVECQFSILALIQEIKRNVYPNAMITHGYNFDETTVCGDRHVASFYPKTS